MEVEVNINKKAHELRGLCWHDDGGYCSPESGLYTCRKCGDQYFLLNRPNPNYKDSIADAWQLVEEMEKDGVVLFLGQSEPILERNNERIWTATFVKDNMGDCFNVQAPTAPKAITLAYIKAKGDSNEER